MKHDFTQLQLTRLIYGETTSAEADMLFELTASVPSLDESLTALLEAKKALGEDRFVPTDLTLHRIMVYSAATAPVSAS